MVTIKLEPQCLDCPRIEIEDGIQYTRRVDDDEPFIALGDVTCSHAETCRHMGKGPCISEIVGAFAPARRAEGGE